MIPPGPPTTTTLTVKEVMSDLRISKNAAYTAIARGQIPSIRVGKKILIPRAQYERLLLGEPAQRTMADINNPAPLAGGNPGRVLGGPLYLAAPAGE